MMKKYLDSNVFIWPLLYDDEKADICKRIIFSLSEGKFIGYTSILTWDEVVYALRKQQGKFIAKEEGKRFLQLPKLIFIDANYTIVLSAQKMIERYNLNPRDAIHAATALVNGINEIISDDSDFDDIKEIKRMKLEEFSKRMT
mgnify:FL=1